MDNLEIDDVRGTLRKLKHSSFQQIFGKTVMRSFDISFKNKIFGYRNNATDKNRKVSYKFSEIEEFTPTITDQEKSFCEWKNGFKIKTKEKSYILYAPTEKEYKKWVFAFNIILKKIPEAFPKIPESVFQTALSVFYQAHLNEEDEMKAYLARRHKEDEEKRRQLELEKKKRLEEERRRKQLKEEEERLKLLSKNVLYDGEIMKIVEEAEKKSDEIVKYKKEKISVPKSNNPEYSHSKKQPDKIINFKEGNINDWEFYDRNLNKIKDNELINFNPILEKQNQKLGKAFHSAIKGYVDPTVNRNQLHLENMHIGNQNLDQTAGLNKSYSAIGQSKFFEPMPVKRDIQGEGGTQGAMGTSRPVGADSPNNLYEREFNPLKSMVMQRRSMVEVDLEKIDFRKFTINDVEVGKVGEINNKIQQDKKNTDISNENYQNILEGKIKKEDLLKMVAKGDSNLPSTSNSQAEKRAQRHSMINIYGLENGISSNENVAFAEWEDTKSKSTLNRKKSANQVSGHTLNKNITLNNGNDFDLQSPTKLDKNQFEKDKSEFTDFSYSYNIKENPGSNVIHKNQLINEFNQNQMQNQSIRNSNATSSQKDEKIRSKSQTPVKENSNRVNINTPINLNDPNPRLSFLLMHRESTFNPNIIPVAVSKREDNKKSDVSKKDSFIGSSYQYPNFKPNVNENEKNDRKASQILGKELEDKEDNLFEEILEPSKTGLYKNEKFITENKNTKLNPDKSPSKVKIDFDSFKEKEKEKDRDKNRTPTKEEINIKSITKNFTAIKDFADFDDDDFNYLNKNEKNNFKKKNNYTVQFD
jgi:hypothetical protein